MAQGQDTYIRIYNGVGINPYSLQGFSQGQYYNYYNNGFYSGPVGYGPVYGYSYWYYDPWPWDNRSRYEYEQKLEYRRELYSQRREDQANSRYRTRARINARTGHVPVGPYMYSE